MTFDETNEYFANQFYEDMQKEKPFGMVSF